MVITKPVNVPKKEITSTDIVGFAGGLYLLGDQNGKGNQLVKTRNVDVSSDGFVGSRQSLQKFLPDTVGVSYQKYPALIDNVITYFTADDGKIKWCLKGDDTWTDCGGDNDITTGVGIKTTFLRIMDVLLILNGTDKLRYVDLSNKNVVKYTATANPTGAPTIAPTGLTNTGSYKIYYGYTFSSATGETEISPILTYTVNKTRDTWKADGTEFLTVSRPAGNPTGAKSWSLYIALASNGGTISSSDMLMLAAGLDLNTVSVVDNGTLAIDIGRGNPPAENSTEGMTCTHGIETNGRPVLFGDINNRYNIWIGGDGEYALDFSSSHGGYRAEVSKGTNYYPSSVIGFRNGQGIPSLTILFSNTQGLSKQATLEQQTINYGNQTFVVWGVTEQNYGAAGVASSYGVVNYNGELSFPTTDGFMAMDTQPQLQNVISTRRISKDITPYVNKISVAALEEIIGTAWNNRILWLVPANGFATPTEILVRDMENNGAWLTILIVAQWIGTVSPPDSAAFVYICQGNHTYKLFESFGTVDYLSGAPTPFDTEVIGTLVGMNEAHNAYKAIVQAMFYLNKLLGSVTIGVNYRNDSGRMKTKQKVITGTTYVLSTAGGWSSPQYTYANFKAPAGWSAIANVGAQAGGGVGITKRAALQINDIASECQWFIKSAAGYNNFQLRAVSYEGENLGIKPDLR